MPITPLAISGVALGVCAVWLAMTLPGKSNARKAARAGYFSGAPGRAHLLGGESPLLARQGEQLANGKGFAGDCESEGSRMAKRWPDEQEADNPSPYSIPNPAL